MKARLLKTVYVDKWVDAEILSDICHNGRRRKGEYIIIHKRLEGFQTVLINCPQCGEVLRLRKHRVLSAAHEDLITIEPSINAVNCCGWHGYLTNGSFTNVKSQT